MAGRGRWYLQDALCRAGSEGRSQSDAEAYRWKQNHCPVYHPSSDVNIDKSTLGSDKEEIAADGQEEAIITYNAQDSYGNAIDNPDVKAAIDMPVGMTIALQDFVKGAEKGVYTATLKGTSQGEVSIMPQVGGENAARDAVKVTLSRTFDETKSSFTTNYSEYEDEEPIILKLSLKDKDGKPISGMAGSLNKDALLSVEHALQKNSWTETGKPVNTQ